MIRTGSTDSLFYICTDHLGSITALVNENGTLVERHSYDAWGRERNPSNWNDYTVTTGRLDRGYTTHEYLREFGLINMNGRVYDPILGRMLSPDNEVQDPLNLQNYNRYTYCLNNPLLYTDPTGNTVLSQFFGWVKKNTWDAAWNLLNGPGGLSQLLHKIGVPYFNVDYNTSQGFGYNVGNNPTYYPFEETVDYSQVVYTAQTNAIAAAHSTGSFLYKYVIDPDGSVGKDNPAGDNIGPKSDAIGAVAVIGTVATGGALAECLAAASATTYTFASVTEITLQSANLAVSANAITTDNYGGTAFTRTVDNPTFTKYYLYTSTFVSFTSLGVGIYSISKVGLLEKPFTTVGAGTDLYSFGVGLHDIIKH